MLSGVRTAQLIRPVRQDLTAEIGCALGFGKTARCGRIEIRRWKMHRVRGGLAQLRNLRPFTKRSTAKSWGSVKISKPSEALLDEHPTVEIASRVRG